MTVYPRKQEYNDITNNQQLQFFMTFSTECVKYSVND